MHALVAAILHGMARLDALNRNPQLQPGDAAPPTRDGHGADAAACAEWTVLIAGTVRQVGDLLAQLLANLGRAPHAPSCEGAECHPCVRNTVLPISQEGHSIESTACNSMAPTSRQVAVLQSRCRGRQSREHDARSPASSGEKQVMVGDKIFDCAGLVSRW
jgi:hypothetical protein